MVAVSAVAAARRRGGAASSTAAELSVRSAQAAGVRRRPAPDALRLPLAGDDHGGVNRRTEVFAAGASYRFTKIRRHGV
jgi:hypothetical protein